MPKVTFSQGDILRAKLLPPGWYPMVVTKYTLEQAGTDGSDLHVYEVKVDGGAFDKVPLRFQVSEKALGMGIEFLECSGQQIQPGVQIEMEQPVGKKLDGYVQRGEYKGRPNNQVVSFRIRK